MFCDDYIETHVEPQYESKFHRNVKIRIAYARRDKTPVTYGELAKKHKITNSRVQQIVAKFQRIDSHLLHTLHPRSEAREVLAKYGHDVGDDFNIYGFLEYNTLFEDGPMQRELYRLRESAKQVAFFRQMFAIPKPRPEPPAKPIYPTTFSSLSIETQRALDWHGIKSLLRLHDWLASMTKKHPDKDTKEALMGKHLIGAKRAKEILAFAEEMQVWSNKRRPMQRRRAIR